MMGMSEKYDTTRCRTVSTLVIVMGTGKGFGGGFDGVAVANAVEKAIAKAVAVKGMDVLFMI